MTGREKFWVPGCRGRGAGVGAGSQVLEKEATRRPTGCSPGLPTGLTQEAPPPPGGPGPGAGLFPPGRLPLCSSVPPGAGRQLRGEHATADSALVTASRLVVLRFLDTWPARM